MLNTKTPVRGTDTENKRIKHATLSGLLHDATRSETNEAATIKIAEAMNLQSELPFSTKRKLSAIYEQMQKTFDLTKMKGEIFQLSVEVDKLM